MRKNETAIQASNLIKRGMFRQEKSEMFSFGKVFISRLIKSGLTKIQQCQTGKIGKAESETYICQIGPFVAEQLFWRAA